MMLRCVLWIAFFTLAWTEICCAAVAKRKNIVCYHGTWSTYRESMGKFYVERDIDPYLCTHLIYAFFGIGEAGELRILDPYLDLEDGKGNIKKFMQLKLKNPTLKILAAVGGWNDGSKNFSIVAADPVKRATFTQNAVRFLQVHTFDGIDIDWEYPNQRHKLANDDKKNFVLLLKELKEALDPFDYILSAALSGAKFSADLSYDIPEIVKYLDLINVMVYDLHGAWDPVVGHNAPMYEGPADTTDILKQKNFDAVVKYWLSQGAPRDKLVIGVPFYGHSFTLADKNNHIIGASHIGPGIAGPYSMQPGTIGYNELCEMFKKERSSWVIEWDNIQKTPYAYSGQNWISFDNEKSMKIKAEYVVTENLAGMFVWTVEFDDFHGICSSKRYPLLRQINDVLFNRTDIPIFECDGTDGYFRDSQNCGKFYFCDNNDAHVFECPQSLYFDMKSLNCIFPNLVIC